MSDKYTVQDLVISAIQQRPVDFEDAFNALMADKIQDRVDARKEDVAKHMYAVPVPESTPEETPPNADENFEYPEDKPVETA